MTDTRMDRMHLDTEQLQRAVHGELIPPERTAHLATCQECTKAVARARAEELELFALLGAVDHPRQPLPVQRVVARARQAGHPLQLRWAAGLVIAAGLAGVAWAVPSSPLRRWVNEWRGSPAAVVTPVRPAPAPPMASDLSGVSVAPGAAAVVVFTDTQSLGEARVTLTDGTEIEVQAPAGAVRYATGAGRLTIANANATASYDVRVPRTAPRVEIRVGGAQVWLKVGMRTTSPYPSVAGGMVRIPLRGAPGTR